LDKKKRDFLNVVGMKKSHTVCNSRKKQKPEGREEDRESWGTCDWFFIRKGEGSIGAEDDDRGDGEGLGFICKGLARRRGERAGKGYYISNW